MDNRILVHYRTATEYKTTIKINKSKNNIKKSCLVKSICNVVCSINVKLSSYY